MSVRWLWRTPALAARRTWSVLRDKRDDLIVEAVVLFASVVAGLRVDAWVKQRDANSVTRDYLHVTFLEAVTNSTHAFDIVEANSTSDQNVTLVYSRMRVWLAERTMGDGNLPAVLSPHERLILGHYVERAWSLNKVLDIQETFLERNDYAVPDRLARTWHEIQLGVREKAADFLAYALTLRPRLEKHFDRKGLYGSEEATLQREMLEAEIEATKRVVLEGRYIR